MTAEIPTAAVSLRTDGAAIENAIRHSLGAAQAALFHNRDETFQKTCCALADLTGRKIAFRRLDGAWERSESLQMMGLAAQAAGWLGATTAVLDGTTTPAYRAVSKALEHLDRVYCALSRTAAIEFEPAEGVRP